MLQISYNGLIFNQMQTCMFLETVGGIVVIGIGIWRKTVEDIRSKNISLHFFFKRTISCCTILSPVGVTVAPVNYFERRSLLLTC